MTPKLWGSTIDNLPAVEQALGRRVDLLRLYGTLYASAGLSAADGRGIIASYKFLNPSRVPLPVAQVAQGALVGPAQARVNEFVSVADVDDIIVGEHEIDGHAASLSGSPADLLAGVLWFNRLIRNTRGFKSKVGCIVVGWDLPNRLVQHPEYKQALADADVLLFDQPYNGPVAAGVDVAGPAVDILTATFPGKPIYIGEWGSNPGPGRAQHITDFGKALATPRFDAVKGACYWMRSEPGFDCGLSGADLAAWAAAGNALAAPDPVGQLALVEAELQASQAQVASLTAKVDAARTALA